MVLTGVLTVETKGISDDMTVVWVRTPTGRGEADGSAYQVNKLVGIFLVPDSECETDKVHHTH